MNFDQAFTALIGNEGGFQADPGDRGSWTGGVVGQGKLSGTNFGISAMSYPGEDIRNMTLDRAKAIYQRDFWSAAGCDTVPDSVRFDLFDFAVNSGVRTAIRALQTAVGETADGVLGALTLQAVSSMPAPRLAARFAAERLLVMTALATWPAFGRGWVRRVAAGLKTA